MEVKQSWSQLLKGFHFTTGECELINREEEGTKPCVAFPPETWEMRGGGKE
jgi:hypothetical protein